MGVNGKTKPICWSSLSGQDLFMCTREVVMYQDSTVVETEVVKVKSHSINKY